MLVIKFRIPQWSSEHVRRVSAGAEFRRQAMNGGRSRRRCKRGKAAGVATDAWDRERSWRMVVLGRRIARGGLKRGTKYVSDRSEWTGAGIEAEHRSGERVRSR
jgi:hypothetical protein